MTSITVWDYDTDPGTERQLPTRKAICPTCRGEGTHARNLGAFTMEDVAEQWGNDAEEFMDDYRAGMYDSVCEDCHGIRVVDEVDRVTADPRLVALYDAEQQADADYRAEVAAEIRMGA